MFWAAARDGKVERGPLLRVRLRQKDGGAMMAAFAKYPAKSYFGGEDFPPPNVSLPD
jgi:hypothetical protein